MPTQVTKVKAGTSGTEAVLRAVEVLRAGGLVAFPTETVYGVGARADNPEAMQRLRTVKSRTSDQAFTVHIGEPRDAEQYTPRLSGMARRLIRKAWPGPLTLIIPVDDPAAAPVMAGLNGSAMNAMYFEGTIGLRCPEHPVAGALLRDAGGPVVASSANLAGKPPPLSPGDVLRDLNGRIDLLIDAGRTKYSRASTIVEVHGDTYRLVREGVYDAGIVKRLAALRILFVCTGNTCRSPMAAALTGKILAGRLGCDISDLTAHGIFVESAGTSGGLGGASENAVKTMAGRGIDIGGHTSTALTADLIRRADFIFAMTRAHREHIIELVPASSAYASTLLENEDVQDPLGGSEEAYEACARRLEDALERRLQEIPV